MRKRKRQNPRFLEWAYQPGDMPSAETLRQAFKMWILLFPYFQTDINLRPFVGVRAHTDWLRKARESLLLSTDTVAKKMNVSRFTYAKIEKRERALTIKLATLIKAAEAMDCELIYAIRPKCGRRFSTIIWEHLVAKAKDHVRVRRWPDQEKARPLAGVALQLLNDTHFRQDMGWAEKRPAKERRRVAKPARRLPPD